MALRRRSGGFALPGDRLATEERWNLEIHLFGVTEYILAMPQLLLLQSRYERVQKVFQFLDILQDSI